MTTVSNLNIPFLNGEKAQMVFTMELDRLSDSYVPFKTGILKNSVKYDKDFKAITYNTPYARRLWYGDSFKFNQAPIRGSRWTERAFADNKAHLIKITAKAMLGR